VTWKIYFLCEQKEDERKGNYDNSNDSGGRARGRDNDKDVDVTSNCMKVRMPGVRKRNAMINIKKAKKNIILGERTLKEKSKKRNENLIL
jgi:hypothetical protein